jgi:DNA-binding MarR family transcriptional regulator
MKLTTVSVKIMKTLRNNENKFNGQSIAKKVNATKTQCSRNILLLEKENIVIRENMDKREKRIKLTDKGKEIILKIIDLEQLGVFIR